MAQGDPEIVLTAAAAADAVPAAPPAAQPIGGVALIAAAIVWSVSILFLNVVPVVFQALQLAFGLEPARLGVLGAASMLAAGLVTATGPFWVMRVNARRITVLALIANAAGLAAIAIGGIGFLLPGFLFIGLAGGIVSTPAYAALGNAADPTRAYGRALFLAGALASIASVLLSTIVIPRFGGAAVLLVLAGTYVLTIPCALVLADVRASALPAATSKRPAPRLPLALLAAPVVVAIGGALYQAASSGTYQMIAAIGTATGIAAGAIGPLVSLAIIASLAGAILPAILGERVRTSHMVALTVGGVWLAYLCMTSASTWLFGAGFILHTIVMTVAYVYILGAVRLTDATDRMYIAYPAILSAAIALGVAGAGFLVAEFGPATLFRVNAAFVFIGWLALMGGQRLQAPR